jgi:phage baseplate assembly protein W
MASRRSLYRGFSTFDTLLKGKTNFKLSDRELVKRDLLNYIYTIPGERLMLPDFGTRIPLLAFEPLDPDTMALIEADLRKAVDYDPRLELIEVTVNAVPDSNTIVALLDVRYVELDITDTIRIEFSTGS